ncbi:DUF481 domain-containing protein [Flammeovirga sp. SJP92]|uniref:DUF481 domain-containing protein n=1 Tax=Flammeovirga sp. SJP92 TaxID=1775430 RepID=UPI000788E522|nr:DUF481 domain-containing protein [Flammeovirga sp. SJP92]KXX70727.1 hypothetical protein AVL50_07895 [Flammeovirga sp. SJP92]
MRYLLLLITIFYSYHLQAQILNVEKARLDQGDSVHWVGNIALNYRLINQQIRTQGGGLKTNFARVGKVNDLVLISDLSFLNSEGFDLLQNGFIHGRIEFLKNRKISYEVFSQLQYDQVKGMNERFLIGGNFRYNPIDNDTDHLAIGLGSFYENENWYWEEVTDNETIVTKAQPSIARWNLYITYRSDISDHVFFNFTTYFQSKYSTMDAYRISTVANLNFKISKKLYFNNNFTLWYENQPYVPIDKLNYTIINGIGYNF